MSDTIHDEVVTTSITSILALMGLECSSVDVRDQHGTRIYSINTTESGKLIGTNGETLHALNTVIKRMLEDKVPREFRYAVDVNGYQDSKVKSLEAQARVVAERVRTFKYDIDMPAMNAYERMIVHSTLKEMPDITTRSEGEGPLRHIVVSFKQAA